MMVKGVTMAQLQDIASAVPGVRVYSEAQDRGRFVNFRLGLDGETYRRYSPEHYWPTGRRRVNAVCWHGHRDFLTELFRRYSDAHVKTMMADYKGIAEFRGAYPSTYYRNAGSQMFPQDYGSLCDCDD